MNTMTSAEKQRAYRQRKEAAEIAQNRFGGKTEMTYPEFLEVVGFTTDDFLFCLNGLGEETDEHQEEREDIRTDAFETALEEAYEELRSNHGDDFDEEDKEDIRIEANERARGSADEAVKDWQDGIEDYNERCVVYQLEDLIAAYREACSL